VKSTLILTALFVALLVTPASASVLDLTADGTCAQTTLAGCSINGAVYNQTAQQSTGTGVIEPFLRIQANSNESGINTDGPYLLDEKSGTWTHSTLVGSFGTQDFFGTGVQYVRFLLDINENTGQSNELLILNQLRIYTSAAPDLNTVAKLTTSADLRYSLDNIGTDNGVLLNYNLRSGSGAGDLTVYVPASFFPAGTSNQFLYLYSQFGCVDTAVTGCAGQGSNVAGADSSDGFEEWAKVAGDGGGLGQGVPEPSQFVSLFVIGIPVVIGYIRKRRAAQVV